MHQTSFDHNDTLVINYYESTKKHDMKIQHYHDTYEIYLQTRGERYLFLNDISYTLQAGDLYILKPFEIHYTKSREADHYGRYLLNFSEDKLDLLLKPNERRMLLEKLEPGIIHLKEDQFSMIYHLFQDIDNSSQKTGFLAEKLQYSIIFRLLMALTDIIRDNTGLQETVSITDIQPEIVQAIHYLNKHYQESLDLDLVAEKVHMSKYHFCRLFHKATGATFLGYLNNIRLTKVHRLLLETELSLADIAKKTGFTSTAHLSRIFRSVYHMSPREFRKTTKDR